MNYELSKKFNIFFTIIFVFLFLPKLVWAETIISSSDCYINEDKTWVVSGSPYLINCHVQIAENKTLTIEEGTEVHMQNGIKFDIYGTLNISGTETNKVVFTSSNEEYITDNSWSFRWGGFVFYPSSKGNINYLDAKYAGGAYIWPQPGGPMVMNVGGDISIKNSKFYKNYGPVFYLKSGSTTIDNNLIDQNGGGVSLENGFISLTNSIISNSDGQAFGAYNGKIYLRNNIFSNNKSNGYISLSVDFDTASTTFIGGDYDSWLISGSPIGERTLSNIDGKPIVSNGFIIESGNTLNIAPGTIIKGNALINRGTLNLNGTKEKPIIFTSITDDNSSKNSGIETDADGTTNISHTFIKHAGSMQVFGPTNNVAFSALLNAGGNLTADNVHISDTYHTGIYHYDGITNITNSSVEGGLDAGIRYYSGDLKINNSSVIPSYANYIFENLSNLGTPDLRNNWWGYPEGPYHPTQNTTGNTNFRLSGDVLFIPFLTEPSKEKQEINPVIIIPGIMGSATKNGKLLIDPILHTYDDLIATLKVNGYIENQNLFSFPYEWRDSNILTANLLKQKIWQVKEECLSANLPDISCNKVDLVAHSMGGLVAREYIQSAQYQNDVDQVIFLGTPHKGSPEAYLEWEAGEFPSGRLVGLIKLKFSIETTQNFYPSLFNYIKGRPISSVQELLPTFDYLKEKDTGNLRTYPDNYPRNTFLEYLNNDISKLLNSGVKITNIVGNTGNKTIEKIRIVPNTSPLWVDGKPDGFENIYSDRGLEMGSGDGTVPTLSSTLNDSIPNEIWADTSHAELPTKAENRIFNLLTGKISSTNIISNIIEKIFSIQLHSPIDVLVIAPDGKRMGKNFETGEEYNEIEGAFYSGYQTDDEYITIPNPLGGEYKIELQGTGNGGEFRVVTNYISDESSVSKEYTDTIKPNEIKETSVITNDAGNILSLEIKTKEEVALTPTTEPVPVPTISLSSKSGSRHHEVGEVLGASTDTQIELRLKLIALLKELISLYILLLKV